MNTSSPKTWSALSHKEVFPGVTMPVYREKDVLAALLEESAEFAGFYKCERSGLETPIEWVLDSELPDGLPCRGKAMDTADHLMRVSDVPLSPDYAFDVAHEIYHLHIQEEGFPLVRAVPPFEGVCRAMNHMLHDVLVNPQLKKYGFDLSAELRAEVAAERKLIAKQKNHNEDPVGRLQRIFAYAAKLLQEEFLADGKVLDDRYRNQHRKAFPKIENEARQVVDIVKDVGIDSPEKLDYVYRLIVQRYGLENAISAIEAIGK